MYTGPIIDTHFHIFRRADIPQKSALSAAVVQRDFSLADYRQAMGTARVVAGVVLQAADVGTGMDELAYVERLPPDPLVSRYITYLPIGRTDAPGIVEQLASHPLVAGVRFSPSQVADSNALTIDRVASRQTLRALARHQMVYELSVRPGQHKIAFELAESAPETTFILGHLGKPRLVQGIQRDWQAGIAQLATLPNVLCKVSAPLDGPDSPPYDIEVMRPLVRYVVDRFGFDRILFGSNFPVNLISISCVGWLRMLGEILHDAAGDELERLYRLNACRVFRLPIGQPPFQEQRHDSR